ncbi:MAG: hypothetical protein QME68_05725 [Elusimicrobiota bacterium]|nr:hypothetical protein [Elusimicrobiota bacterium]
MKKVERVMLSFVGGVLATIGLALLALWVVAKLAKVTISIVYGIVGVAIIAGAIYLTYVIAFKKH